MESSNIGVYMISESKIDKLLSSRPAGIKAREMAKLLKVDKSEFNSYLYGPQKNII